MIKDKKDELNLVSILIKKQTEADNQKEKMNILKVLIIIWINKGY